MDISRQPEDLIDLEGDDLDTVAKKLGVESSLEAKTIVLKEENLRYLNDERDTNGNTILMRFARLGKEEIVGFLVKCEGISVNERNREYDTAADIALSEHHFGCLLKLLQGESEFPYIRDMSELQHAGLVEFIEQRKKMHRDIESGDLKSVESYTKQSKSSKFLCIKFRGYAITNQSARSWAAECNQLEIYAYLWNHGAKFKDLDEEKKCSFKGKYRKDLNHILEGYFDKVDNSHVLKLMQSSQSPQVFSDLRKAKIRDIYDHLNKFEFVSLIMKVLEYEDVDVVFDFENEHTNDVYCLNNSQIYGFTLPSKQRIFIGAKKCESAETVSMDVAGTLAHELCHMAMEVLYRNEAKPYEAGEKETSVFEEYEGIVRSIQMHCQDEKEKVDRIIKMVYKYNRYDWHSEIIARVPHILAMYGDIVGKAKLQEQAKGLLEFYSAYVIPKCKEYTDSAFFKKALCLIESLHKHHGCVQDVEKGISPLKEPSKSFKDYLITNGNISLIFSSNTRLCCLHIYHELKKTYSCHMDKQCLFFTLDCLKSNWEKIIDAFKCKVCKYMILVTNENMLNFEKISKDFIEVKGCLEGNDETNCEELKKVILIVGEECKGLNDCSKKKVLNYQWSDLSDKYKRYLISPLVVNFKGKETNLTRWIDKNKLSEIIQPEDVQRLTNKEQILLDDGIQLTTERSNVEYYMRRTFVKHTVNKSIFCEAHDSIALFVTGLSKEDLEGFDNCRRRIQWIEQSSEEIGSGKRIFIQPSEVRGIEFFDRLSSSSVSLDSVFWLHFSEEEFNPRIAKENRKPIEKHIKEEVFTEVFWLHYFKEEFNLRMATGSTKSIEKHIKEEVFTERQLVDASKERVVLISDDPGMGKSTVLTELIRIMKDEHPDWWVGRINLNEYAYGKENPLSLANIEEDSKVDDVLDIFICMLGMKTKLQVYLFKQFVKPGGLNRKYKIFIDAFDEISDSYKGNVLKLFRCLIEETSLQLYITTRRHEKLCLETEFGTLSYSLKEFTVDVQVTYLDNLWKHRMKSLVFQNSEEDKCRATVTIREKVESILETNEGCSDDFFKSLSILKDKLNMSDSFDKLKLYIDGLIFSQRATSLLEETSSQDRFMGIPLYLVMLGNVVYDNNFRQEMYSNVHVLYSDFFIRKIRVFVIEKAKLQIENDIGKEIFNCVREKISHFHKSVAKCVIDPDSYSWDSFEHSDVSSLDVRVGLLTKSGNQFQFLHRTFAEFFFSEWLLEMIECGTLEEEKMREVIREDRHSVIRRFLDGALQRGDICYTFNKTLIQKWDLAKIFRICSVRAAKGDFTGTWLLRAILSEFQKCDPSSINVFLNEVSSFFNVYKFLNINIFKLLNVCFSDALLSQFLTEDVEPKLERVFDFIGSSPADGVSEVLGLFKRVYRMRSRHSRRVYTSGAHVLENERNGDAPETDGVASGEENRMTLFDARDRYGWNVFHHAAGNKDRNVFATVIGLARELLGEEELVKYVLERDINGRILLHWSAGYGRGNILNIISDIKSIVDSMSLVGMFRAKDNHGRNFLYEAAENCPCETFKSLLEYLCEIEGVNLLKDLLFEEDNGGRNILHWAAQNRDVGTLDSALKHTRIELKDEKKFTELVMGCDEDGRTIFHWRARCGYFIELDRISCPISVLSLLESYIERDGLRELLAKLNNKRETWLHVLFEYSFCAERVLDGLSLISDLFDVDSLKEFILATSVKGDTIFHRGAKNISLNKNGKWKDIVSALKVYLNESSFEMLMKKRNKKGQTVRIVEHGNSSKFKLHGGGIKKRIKNRLKRLYKM